MTMALLINL